MAFGQNSYSRLSWHLIDSYIGLGRSFRFSILLLDPTHRANHVPHLERLTPTPLGRDGLRPGFIAGVFIGIDG